MAKVPYRDIMQGPNDLAENRIQLLSSSLAIVTPLMHAGKIKVLAVTSRQRAPNAPDVPTVREAGYPALEMDSPGGLFGPRDMPLAVREKIAADVRAVVASDPELAKPLIATGQIVRRARACGVRRQHQGIERQARRHRQRAGNEENAIDRRH